MLHEIIADNDRLLVPHVIKGAPISQPPHPPLTPTHTAPQPHSPIAP